MIKGPLKEILKMSKADRISAVQAIWNSIENEPEESGISENLKSFLDKRIEEYQKNPDKVFSWNDVKEEYMHIRKK